MSRVISAKNNLRLMLVLLVVAFVTAVHFSSSTRVGRPVPVVFAASGGVVDVLIGDGSGSLVFTPGECHTMIASLSRCFSTLAISNAGGAESVPFQYTIEASADTDGLDSGAPGAAGDEYGDCFSVTLATGSAAEGRGSGPVVSRTRPDMLPLSASELWTVGVWVNENNACQGATTTVVAAVSASGTLLTPTPTPTFTATPTPEATSTPVAPTPTPTFSPSPTPEPSPTAILPT